MSALSLSSSPSPSPKPLRRRWNNNILLFGREEYKKEPSNGFAHYYKKEGNAAWVHIGHSVDMTYSQFVDWLLDSD